MQALTELFNRGATHVNMHSGQAARGVSSTSTAKKYSRIYVVRDWERKRTNAERVDVKVPGKEENV